MSELEILEDAINALLDRKDELMESYSYGITTCPLCMNTEMFGTLRHDKSCTLYQLAKTVGRIRDGVIV